MKIHTTPDFKLVFCDANDGLFPAGYLDTSFYPLDLTHSPYSVLASQAAVKSVVILKQTHSTQGFCVEPDNLAALISAPRHEGDFLCTALPGVGIGVLTADCLPMAFYDPVHKVVAMVHAGWRGTVDLIGKKTLETMRHMYGTKPEDVQVFMGPCAKTCCYQVSEDFVEYVRAFSWADKVFERCESGLYFNLPRCNALLLQDAGVRPESIINTYNTCTICTSCFCSYRRDAAASCRQLSLIVLS